MLKIAPSILSADFLRLGEDIKSAELAGADLIHVDVMDGHFVPNITIGPAIVEAVNGITGLPLDVHLMIEKPDNYLQNFIDAGADFLTVHYEAVIHLHRTIQHIKEKGIKAGVSLNPSTPVNCLEEIINDIDMVLIMSVNPGFGGQKYITQSTDKIKRLKDLIVKKNSNALIEVDGGIGTDNAYEVISAGADILVMGSAFFKSGDYEKFIKKIRKIAGDN
ncbi:MAG: ribulose-phosphate 3-epimerase [Nitrospirae bacterium]|jgi:ribulose-phosphate 3-epimerase|nr:ribulose-phosphate 3-epimerase [Nitrospirota bacterium]